MTKTDKKSRIDAIEVGEVLVNAFADPSGTRITTKYALTDSSSGDRFGAGHCNTGWSDRSLALLQDLLKSLEQDIVEQVFPGATTSSSEGVAEEPTTDGVASL